MNLLKPKLLRVVLIGPESSGKTWLAQDLASRYDVCWSQEYVRQFVESHRRPVVYGDVEAIGRGQPQGQPLITRNDS